MRLPWRRRRVRQQPLMHPVFLRVPREDAPMTRAEVAAELADLMQRSGMCRLEMMRGTPGCYGGYCVDAEGEHWRAQDYLPQG